MMKRVIFSHLLFTLLAVKFMVSCKDVNGVNGDVEPEDYGIEQHVLNELKLYGFVKAPTTVEGWKKAVRSLEREISNLRRDISDLKTNHTTEISALKTNYSHEISALKTNHTTEISALKTNYSHEISTLKTNYSHVEEDLAEAINHSIYANYHSAIAVLILREDLEIIECIFSSQFVFPSKETMLNILKQKKNTDQVKFRDVFTENEWKLMKELSPQIEMHALKWLYYLSNCKSVYAGNFRDFFKTHRIPVYTFCRLVGSIYEKTNHGIHRAGDSKLTTSNIIEGLKLYGITQHDMLSCAEYLIELLEIPGGLCLDAINPDASKSNISAKEQSSNQEEDPNGVINSTLLAAQNAD